MFNGREWNWAYALLGAAFGSIAGYVNYVRTGSAWWWLAAPVLTILFAWRHPDDEDGPPVD